MQRRGKAKPRFRAKSLIFVFDSYVLDTGRRELRCGDTVVSVQPQVFDLLEYLIRNRGHVVSRDELLDAIWSRRIVSESTLATRINAARSAIGDDGESQRLIRTLPRKGIRFVGEVRERAIKTEQSLIAFNRPAIAVLPFQNMSGDPEQEYFADGMVDEIITGLSRIKWLLVTSRNSSFVYKSRSRPISGRCLRPSGRNRNARNRCD